MSTFPQQGLFVEWREAWDALAAKLGPHFDRLTSESGVVPLKKFVMARLPPASKHVGGMIYISDEAGGATPAFSDGVDWRRVSDRAVVS